MFRSPLLPKDNLSFRDLSVGAIARWRLLLVGALGFLMLSAMAWIKIPRLEEPRIEVMVLGVTLVYPGASPEDVEVQVLKPLEEVLFELPKVEWVEATALPNVASFAIKFEDGTPMDVAVEKVRGKVLGKKRDLPTEVKDPEVVHWSTSLTPQMVVALTGHVSEARLYKEARRLKFQLVGVDGVAGVDLHGGAKPALRVELDPARLARHGLTAEAVARALQLQNVRIPGGELNTGEMATLLQVNHTFGSVEDARMIPVTAGGGLRGDTHTVRLGDVAEVREDALTPDSHFFHQGRPGIGLSLRFRDGADSIATGRRVHERLAQLRKDLPSELELGVSDDQPAWISASVSGFIQSLLEGMALVMVIITLGMGWRAAAVVSAVIPLSVGGAVLGLHLFGFSLETTSIGGLVVALGLLVDDAVVVTESVQILRDKGLSAVRGAVLGTSRVFWANNATTMVAIASFLPLFAMGGDTGAYIKGLPTSVVLCLLISLGVAQLLTPWLSTFLLRKRGPEPEVSDAVAFDRSEDRLEGEHAEQNPVLRYLRGVYERVAPVAVRHPGKVVLGATGLLVGALALFPLIGFEFFPKADKQLIFVTLRLPRGARLEATEAKLQQVQDLIGKDGAVRGVSAVSGGSYPATLSSKAPRGTGTDSAELAVRVKPGADAAALATRLRRALADVTGTDMVVEELSYGPPVSHPVLVRVYGEDFTKLRSVAEEVKAKLRTIPGAIQVSDSLADTMPLTRVKLDADRAFRTGVTPAQVGQSLRAYHGEDKVTEFREGEELVEVILSRTKEPGRPMESLGDTLIPNASGTPVALKDAGKAELDFGPATLKRRNTRRLVEVYADVAAGTQAAQVVGQLDPWLKARAWEPGYSYGYAGEQEETSKSFRNLGIAAVSAMVLIFLLLLLLFNDILLAILVMLAVPFALTGALPGLALTGNPFGFMAFLGLIALIGVYVNHKIYFVDRMLELMRRGVDFPTAVRHAGLDRLRPVVLTAMTAILGLVPLTFWGEALWSAFGWVNIFGLIASIPLSLVLLPALISLAWRWTGRFKPEGTK